MLTAKKSPWFENLFAVYNRNLFKRRFHSFKVSGLELLQDRKVEAPFLIYANHSSWWDGLAAFEISRAVELNSFYMMEEKHLQQLFLFRRLGAFSVVRENRRKAVESINYAADLLKTNFHQTVWIFPQGEILPGDARPVKFFNGISRIIEKTAYCHAVPLAFRYEFLKQFKPEIFIKVGAPQLIKYNKDNDSKILTIKFEAALTGLLDELKTEVLSGETENYHSIF